MFDTEFALLAGLDRGDPLKEQTTWARTILTVVAKGLPGSRSSPEWKLMEDMPEYFYFLVHLAVITDHSIHGIKEELLKIKDEFESIETLGSERYGVWDLVDWCESEEIGVDIHTGSYKVQRDIFTGFFLLLRDGLFKSPEVLEPGSYGDDILMEELRHFEYQYENDQKGWFGSSEKRKRGGAQDDSVFSLGSAIYSGRALTPDDFRTRSRRSGGYFGGVIDTSFNLLGDYG